MGRITTRMGHTSYDSALEKLIAENRVKLITESVGNTEVRARLLQIDKLFKEIEQIDPGAVAAWGGGCGAGCAVAQPGMGEMRPVIR